VLDAGDIAEAPKTPPKAPATAPAHAQAAAQSEALSALSNLGYAPAEGAAAVAQVATDAPDADTATLIRAALRLLAPKG
jgi:Holliday junction DNA helicase RuvA